MAQSIRLAVLIDGENICGDVADELFGRIAGLGDIVIRRVYGNFIGSQAKTWLGPIARHGIVAQQVCGTKNAADFALTIDAMQFLSDTRIDGFCIVSGDRDFALLAARLRERGADVFGFGKRNTAQSYRANCTHFAEIEGETSTPARVGDHPATALIGAAMEGLMNAEGWAELSKVGQSLLKRERNYKSLFGCRYLHALAAETEAFELGDANKRIRHLNRSGLKLAS